MQQNRKKIKVLFILSALHKDGAILSTLTTIKHLDKSWFDPKLFVLKSSSDSEHGISWNSLLEDIDLSYGLKPSEKLSRHAFLLIARLYNLVKRSDIIVGGLEMMPTFLAVLMGKLAGKPSLGFIRTSLPELLSVLPWHYKVLTKCFYPYLGRAVAISKGVKTGTGILLPKLRDRISVVYSSIDLDQIRMLGHLALPEAEILRPYFLAVGRLVPQKGFDVLLQGYLISRKQGIKQKLVIVGEGKGRKSLEALIEDLELRKHVHLAGFQENPYAWMKNADIVISSSRVEGFGRVLAEAQAIGTAVISTDCPAGPVEVLECGRSGILVKNEDPRELAMAIIDLSNKPAKRQQLSIRGLERVKEFDLRTTISSFEDILICLTKPKLSEAKVQSGMDHGASAGVE